METHRLSPAAFYSLCLPISRGPILGVEALEALGLIVDPGKKRLSPSRPYAVRLGGYR
jgi:hypothetical protein